MKISLVTVLTIAAIATGMSGCERSLTRGGKPAKPFVLVVPKGHRLKLKVNSGQPEEEAVKAFKQLLSQHVDPTGGTLLNLRFKPDKSDQYTNPNGYKEEDCRASGGTVQFTPRPKDSQRGPDGSLHNTQRIAFKSEEDIKPVLESLDASFNP